MKGLAPPTLPLVATPSNEGVSRNMTPLHQLVCPKPSSVQIIAPKDLDPEQRSIQLELPLEGIQEELINTLRALLGPMSLRHWAAMQHALSIKAGRVGQYVWNLQDHMNVHAEIQLHPALYAGVRNPATGEIGSNWYPQAPGIPRIDHTKRPHAIALGLILPIRWRWAWLQGRDCISMTGASLLRAAGITYYKAKPSRTWKRLEDNLEELRRADGPGAFDWASSPWTLQGLIRLYPPGGLAIVPFTGWFPQSRCRVNCPRRAVNVSFGERIAAGHRLSWHSSWVLALRR